MGFLATTAREQSAASAVGLAVLASCVLLMIYRPRRTELEGTPHDVPLLALGAVFVWIVLAAGTVYATDPAPKDATLSVGALWIVCAVSLVEIGMAAAAYLLPRALRPATLEPSPQEVVEVFGDRPVDEQAAEPLRTDRWIPDDWAQHVAVGFTVGLAALVPTALFAAWFAADRDPNETHILLKTLQGKGWDYLFPIILAAGILAPLKEELLFRVILQGWLADRMKKLAIPLTAAVFALVHGAADAPLLVPLALILGALYEYRRSYLEVVAAHAAFNGANLFAAINS